MKVEDKTIAEEATPEEITTEEELYDEIDSLDEEEIDAELEHIFDFEKEEVDEEVMIQCRDMLSDADVSDPDRTDLSKEISDGITIEEFSEKLQEAVEKKKKEFEKMSADEKGQSLEDELAAELAELEDELDEEDDDIEEKILKEIEDLENL